jgi:opacity protein-like surface antigen
MKRLVLLCALVLCFTCVASAQDTPKGDLFAGYSFAHLSENGFGINFNGGSASGSFNVNNWLGLVADFGGYHTNTDGISANSYTYLFGPRIYFGHGKISPFVQNLYGGAHATGENSCPDVRVHSQATFGCGSGSENAFALTLGGGVDWNATEHLGVRLIQAEYFLSRFGGSNQNGVRISTGVTFRF